jgi:hypothetical protein
VANATSARVTAWAFTPDTGQKAGSPAPAGSPVVQGPSGRTTWAGALVANGSISVSISGFGTLQQAIEVDPRAWHTQPPAATEVPNGKLVVQGQLVTLPVPPTPTGDDSGLGKFGWAIDPGTLSIYTIPLASDGTNGPNTGYWYVTAAPGYTTLFASYIINPDLENGQSTFSMHQCGTGSWISWTNLLTQTKRHEYAGASQSHYAEYKTALNTNNPGDTLERYVAIPSKSQAQVFDEVRALLSTLSSTIGTAVLVEPYPVNFNEAGRSLGNINYGPQYATCN